MKGNLGNKERGIRLVIAALFLAFYFLEIGPQYLGVIGLGVAVTLTFTSLIGFCPMYYLFGFSTAEKKSTR
jgi:hypothetical protein